MKISKRNSNSERRILTGMIVDRNVLAKIASKWEGELFRSKWSNLIAGWCVKYFNKYNRAPKRQIEVLFEQWATEDGKDKETVSLVEKFLNSLSDEYDSLARESNSEYILDLAAEHFNRVRLTLLKESIEGDIEAGDLEKGFKRIHEFSRLELGTGAGIDVLADKEAFRQAFTEKRESIVKYPGALGEFFGDALERDGFIAFMGPEKRGKTWCLLDMAFRAMSQGKRVAFFEVGDMTQNQILRRFGVRAAKKPMKPKTVRIPKQILHDPESEMVEVQYDERKHTKGLDWLTCWKAIRKLVKSKELDRGLLRLSCHPNSTLSVLGMKSILQGWERTGWVPDVIITDYADILAPMPGMTESRDQINATWKYLRSLSQSLHCLVVTATQAKATSYRAETIDRTHFSEDKRKLAHVTGMIGLNATEEEKKQGIMRLNWIALREAEFTEDFCVYTAGCLDIGNPFIRSCF